MSPDDLFALIEGLAGKNSRVDGLDVLNALVEQGSYASIGTAREEMSAMLTSLKRSDRIGLPVGRHLWDYATRTPIPKWIQVARESAATGGFDLRRHAWHPALGFLGDASVVQNVKDLLAIDRWLRAMSPDEPHIPVKERSWEIFGQEKKLESFAATQWFGPGRVTWELLRCYVVPLIPLHRVIRDGAPMAVISENEAGFDSLCQFAASTKAFRCVVFGNGLAIEKAVGFLVDLMADQGLTRCVYVGDVDPAGIAIPQRLDAALRAAGSLSVEPWLTAYEFMLGPLVDSPDISSEQTSSWLPRELGRKARLLFESGSRVAQESFGRKQMFKALNRPEDVPNRTITVE